MKLTLRITPKQDPHLADEYAWPANAPFSLPGIGDFVTSTRFGSCKVILKSFTYDDRSGSKDGIDLIVDIGCE